MRSSILPKKLHKLIEASKLQQVLSLDRDADVLFARHAVEHVGNRSMDADLSTTPPYLEVSCLLEDLLRVGTM